MIWILFVTMIILLIVIGIPFGIIIKELGTSK